MFRVPQLSLSEPRRPKTPIHNCQANIKTSVRFKGDGAEGQGFCRRVTGGSLMLTSLSQSLDMCLGDTAAAAAVLLGKSWTSSGGGGRPEHKAVIGSVG